VVLDLVTIGYSYAVDLQPVVDARVARDRYVVSTGEDSADLEDAPCPLLAEIAMARHDGDRFVLNPDLHPPTSTFGSSSHAAIVRTDPCDWATLRQISSVPVRRVGTAPSGTMGIPLEPV